MKNLYALLLFAFFSATSFAAPIIKAKSNSNWKNRSNWDLDRMPMSGDTINIPKGVTVVINDDEVITGSVYIKVEGVLNFEDYNSTLRIDAGTIEVAGGFINGGGSASQKIFIGNTIVFKGNEPSISGFQLATASSPYFAWVNAKPLPVTFLSFNVAQRSGNVLVQWSTASEVNSSYFDIERSYDGNVWTVLDKVKAAGTSSITNNYSYTDRTAGTGAVYYRIREVDTDGGFAFTSIQSIQGANNGAIRIASMPNNILLQFPGMTNSAVTVRIVSLAGQVIQEKLIGQPAGQVMLPTSMKGNYIVSVSNGHDINVARQVAL